MSSNENIIKDFFYNKQVVGFWVIPIVLTIIAGSFLLVQDLISYGLYIGALVSLPLAWFCIYYPKVWIYLISLSGLIYFKSSGEGVSALEVVIGVVYLLGTVMWFVNMWVVKKEKVVQNIIDWFIMFYMIFGFSGVVIGVVNDVDFLSSLKEHLTFAVLLLYFPFRYYIKSKSEIITLLVIYAVVVFVMDFLQFYGYYKIVTQNLMYAYQLGRTVRTNQTLYTAGAIAGITYFFYSKKLSHKIMLLIFSGTTVAALISTFSRTFWVVIILQLVILFVFLNNRKRIQFAVLFGVISVITLSLAFLLMKDNTRILLATVSDRFVSTGKGTQDVSVQSRLHEYDAAIKKIYENPLGGNGYYKPFIFFEPIMQVTSKSVINHNGYIFMAYRMGIPMAIVYFLFLFGYLMKSVVQLFTIEKHDNFYFYLNLCGFFGLILIVIADFAASVHVYRDGIFITILSVFAISQAEEYKKKFSKTSTLFDRPI